MDGTDSVIKLQGPIAVLSKQKASEYRLRYKVLFTRSNVSGCPFVSCSRDSPTQCSLSASQFDAPLVKVSAGQSVNRESNQSQVKGSAKRAAQTRPP
ncbi:hypothetical protein E2C01_064842 [Portunus trituberculatus]|uniref:Uncharacterized protein n=1 Tax=Portunus trituberculatus TaxID=210409 RepID=A0A5B7HE50_PORTR|nr:hypothetical protein [Portunus trituberculatus]